MSSDEQTETIQNTEELKDERQASVEEGVFAAGKIIASESKEPDAVNVDNADVTDRPNLIAVGIRSAFWTFVALVLAFGCFLSFFPYTAMRMYDALDLKYMALVSAEKYMSRNDDKYDRVSKLPEAYGKYSDALYLAVNNSIYFMDEAVKNDGYGFDSVNFYAEKVDRYASYYLDCNILGSLLERTNKIDAYSLNIMNTPAPLHPYVYSYADKLEIARFKAWFALGDYDKINDRTVESDLFTYLDQDTFALEGEGAVSDAQIKDYFLLFSQLSAYIDAELDKLGLGDIIANAEERGQLTSDLVPKTLQLYGNAKPFDLFIYDGNDKKEGITDSAGNVVRDGEFKPLYNRIKQHYEKFVTYLKNNATKYIKDSADANKDTHLMYTYYVKSLTDFTYSMQNMLVLLKEKASYFDRENDNVSDYNGVFDSDYNYWHGKLQIYGVRIYNPSSKDPNAMYVSNGTLKQWFNLGLLRDYTDFYRVNNA